MINRIVRLCFIPEKVDEFLDVFNSSKEKIANFNGCLALMLLQDVNNANVFYTYSTWQSELHLNKYRYSELFKETWAKTKILFNAKPVAYSLMVKDVVK